jgi:signal transduction histidine kinase
MKKLSTKTAFATFISSLVGVFLIAVIIIGLVKNMVNNHLDNVKTNTLAIAKQSLSSPLWNYDEIYIQEVLNSFIDQNLNTVVAIKLFPNDNKKIFTAYNNNFSVDEIESEAESKKISVLTDKVNHRGRELGEVKIYYSTSVFTQEFQRLQIITTAITFLLGVILAYISFRLLSKWLTTPLKEIAADANKVGSGDYDVQFKTNYIGELNIVTQSFNETIKAIKLRDNELIEHNTKLESIVKQRTKDLESFSYSVSHDLRSPLRGIDGWSMALLEDYGDKLDADALMYLNRVRSEAQRMGVLIDSILSLSRILQSDLNIEKVNISEIAEIISRRLKEENPNRSVNFSIQSNLETFGDPRFIEIALTNLLNNSWKFTSKANEAEIEFGMKEIENQKIFYVKDNGAGFNMANAKNLFGPFQRLHKQNDFPGTGIGLATVERIIHIHSGKIWAESELNKGATFFFTFG